MDISASLRRVEGDAAVTDAPISSKDVVSKLCADGEHERCANRSAEESRCQCECHNDLLQKPPRISKSVTGDKVRRVVERLAIKAGGLSMLDWDAISNVLLSAADRLDSLPDETPAPQNMHSDEWWQAELDRCVGVEQAKYRALFAALEGVEALTRYATGTGPDQQRLAKVCRIAQGVKSPDTSPAEAGGEYCACLQGVCMGPDHTDKLCKAEKASGEQS